MRPSIFSVNTESSAGSHRRLVQSFRRPVTHRDRESGDCRRIHGEPHPGEADPPPALLARLRRQFQIEILACSTDCEAQRFARMCIGRSRDIAR